MAKPYAQDLRERRVRAARSFDVSAGCGIKLMRQFAPPARLRDVSEKCARTEQGEGIRQGYWEVIRLREMPSAVPVKPWPDRRRGWVYACRRCTARGEPALVRVRIRGLVIYAHPGVGHGLRR